MTTPDRAKAVIPKLRPKMTGPDVDTMLVTMMRSSAVRAAARRFLRLEYFRADEEAYRLLAFVIIDMVDDHADVESIPYLDLRTAVVEAIESLGAAADQKLRFQLLRTGDNKDGPPGLLHHAYKVLGERDFTVTQALKMVQRFVNERGVDAPLKEAMLVSGGQVVANAIEYIAQRHDLREALTAITVNPVSGFAATAKKGFAAIDIIPTRLSFIDNYTNGGIAVPEIYGITAGTGYGKSTLAHQIALWASQSFQALADGTGRPPRSAIVLSYEDDERRIFARSMACVASIKKATMERCADPEADLLRVRSGYDAELARAAGIPLDRFPTEYERYHAAIAQFVNYRYIDMTEPGLGEGGVDEICAIVARDIEDTGQHPGLVVVDSIDLLVANWLAATYNPDKAQQLLASTIPMVVHALRRRLNKHFQCASVVTNQLAGAELGKRAGARLSHANAGGSKSWGKALDYHWILGQQNEDKVAMFDCTKSRRSEHVGQYALLRLDGAFGRWVDVSDQFTVHNDAICSRALAAEIHGAVPARVLPSTVADAFTDDVAGTSGPWA